MISYNAAISARVKCAKGHVRWSAYKGRGGMASRLTAISYTAVISACETCARGTRAGGRAE